MEKQAKNGRRRLVLLIYPFQGHINPMLQLATILHSKGFSITIVHPQYNAPDPSILPSDFSFTTIPDKLLESNVSLDDFPSLVSTLNKNCTGPLQQCMEQKLREKDPNDLIVGIVYDMLMYCAQTVADTIRLPGICFHTSAAATILAFAVFPSFHGEGYVSFQDSIHKGQLQSLHLKYLLESIPQSPSDTFLEIRVLFTNAIKKASAIIVNSMDFLEQEALKMIRGHFSRPIFTIGPTHKVVPSISSSLLQEDGNCISWLNKQANKSVIYVSFGSLANMDEQTLVEIAWGLANCEQPFLWVVRPGLARGSDWTELLPKDFQDRVGERGCIVRWAPQKEVLAHYAVGGFLSHCGWNSILESICEGVPILCRPFFGDQLLSARYVCDVWKVGLELEGELEKGKISEAIKKLIVDAEGEEIRKNAMNLKEKAQLCLLEEGSSYHSLNEFTQHILSA